MTKRDNVQDQLPPDMRKRRTMRRRLISKVCRSLIAAAERH